MFRNICLSVSVITAMGYSLAEVPKVVTTIKPLHSLVAQVMHDVGEPVLLITSGSPHGYHLTPSDVHSMNEADLLVWVSDDLETFMPESAEKISGANSLVWQEIEGVHLLETRHGGLWEEEDGHESHEHEAHEHGHEHEAHEYGHEHEEHEYGHEHEEHEHEGHHHHHGKYNPHLWLGTENANVLLKAVAGKLSTLDPEHARQYQDNADKATKALDGLKVHISEQLQGLEGKHYMVFHDAYPYFEYEFDLTPVGVVRVDPEHEPGVQRIAEIHDILHSNEIVCVFNEPQFPSNLVAKLVNGTDIKTATLDPIGADLSVGIDMFARLQQQLADSLSECLR